MNTKFLTLILIAFSLVSCKKEILQEGTPVQDMAGEWWVEQYYTDQTEDNLWDNYKPITTFNTADFSTDKMWVDASKAWPFKAKINVDYNTLSFLPTTFIDLSLESEGVIDTISIISGKIIKNVVKAPSGTMTDSIYIEFTSTAYRDLGFVPDSGPFIITGNRRTGFLEDEY